VRRRLTDIGRTDATGTPAGTATTTGLSHTGHGKGDATMNALGIILAIIAIILLFTGGFVQTLNFLLWVGIVLLVIAAIVFLMRFISGRRV
jgi:uncharacterized membrane protein HdeD (DUF308 family)